MRRRLAAARRAHGLARRLALAAGARVRLVAGPAGYLLSLPVPQDSDRLAAVLPLLALADRFGHTTRGGGVVWCAVDRAPQGAGGGEPGRLRGSRRPGRRARPAGAR
ncbi:hypothetical protein AB0K43_08800 [Kitasatospora sp. NPDC049258]|uniref:hypothetical protein n=1 Tax=Kitasatospora sp. NPDC049258 TaxID=3155394 RepID=UPI003423B118